MLRRQHYHGLRGAARAPFSPLGAGSYIPLNMATADQSVLGEYRIDAIARRHGKTPAQVVLRWGVQRGTAVIPKTSRPERLRENLNIFDFELTGEEILPAAPATTRPATGRPKADEPDESETDAESESE